VNGRNFFPPITRLPEHSECLRCREFR
jgi:hypothetical protein